MEDIDILFEMCFLKSNGMLLKTYNDFVKLKRNFMIRN